MEAKQYLDIYRCEERILSSLEYKYRELERLTVGSPDVEIVTINGERHIVPKVSGKRNSDYDKHIVEMIYISKMIDAQKEVCLQRMRDVESVIDRCQDPVNRQLLTLRHIARMDWVRISKEMNYSLRHIQLIYKEKALPEVERIIALNSIRKL